MGHFKYYKEMTDRFQFLCKVYAKWGRRGGCNGAKDLEDTGSRFAIGSINFLFNYEQAKNNCKRPNRQCNHFYILVLQKKNKLEPWSLVFFLLK